MRQVGWLGAVAVGLGVAALLAIADATRAGESGSDVIDLAGAWQFRLDPEHAGEKQQWYAAGLTDRIRLPGSTDEGGYGTKTTEKSRSYLSRLFEYVGPAWYQREVAVPEGWRGRRIGLVLERAHWETRVWVDEQDVGTQNSLSAPHEYDLSKVLAPGRHRLTVRVDNTVKINVGADAHSITRHTQTNWNGVIGRIELRATDRVWIDDLQVYPDVKRKVAKVRATVANATGRPVSGTLALMASAWNADGERTPPERTVAFACPAERAAVETDYPMGDDVLLWDEFSPAMYRLRVALTADGGHADTRTADFGMREFRTRGTQFTLNGRLTFLRGTLECCIFPRTGYPDMSVEGWLRNLKVARAYGLNHLRFHSWCPPEAAFAAADRMGFILHVETPVWTVLGSDPKVDAFVHAEADRILRAYGNHPSFCMLCVGNEPSGRNQKAFLSEIVTEWKAADPRRLYTSCAGWPIIPESDYHSTPAPRGQAWGAGLRGRFNAGELSTDVDYTDHVARLKGPIVSHEIGQYCAYPNFREIPKYTGVLRPYNLEAARDSLARNHMLDQADDFLAASGKLQALLYKEEIETALRTPGFGGFQLLDLHDFPGQGTALVGILDAFWDSKGYVTAREHRGYCCETVPLLRMKKVVWTQDETFRAVAEVAHYGPAPVEKAAATWTVAYADGREVAGGEFPGLTIPLGGGTRLGPIEVPLADVAAPANLTITVAIKGTPYGNRWPIWVYPGRVDTAPPAGVRVADRLDEDTLAALRAGGKVLLLPAPDTVRSNVPPGFTTIFWNTQWTRGQPPHTLGILCDPKHPALAAFPTEFYSNWQWWDLVSKSRAMVLDEFPPPLRPIVQVIDDWNTNRRLALIFEARVGGGKLLVATLDLHRGLASRPVARQMLHSLLKYAGSPAFAPRDSVDLELFQGLFQPLRSTTLALVRVDSEAPGYGGANALDGDPKTMWHTAWDPDAPGFPHEIQVDLGKQTAVKGFTCLPRQDRNPNGTIADYAFYVSADGRDWGEPAARGRFDGTPKAQQVLFAEPRQGRYARLVAGSEVRGQKFASIAELVVLAE